jgi:hypothetical protein
MGILWPAAVVVVLCGWFSYLVGRQYFKNHRLNNLFWSTSLVVAALASLFYCLAVVTHPHSSLFFRLYYVFGAMWMPAIMGLGSIGLLAKQRVVLIFAGAVAIVGIIGTILLFMAPLAAAQLTALDGGAGTGIVKVGIWLVFLIALSSFGAGAVILVAVVSAVQAHRKQAPDRFLHGNIWLAAGVVIISAAGSAARLGWPQLFWVTMLIGWAVTFLGYRLLSPASAAVAVRVQQPAGE